MIQYVENPAFLSEIRGVGTHLMQHLSHRLSKEHNMFTTPVCLGTSRKKLITQNDQDPMELDYILRIERWDDLYNCEAIHQAVLNVFQDIVRRHHYGRCVATTNTISTKRIRIQDDEQITFKVNITVCFKKPDGTMNRLMHEKSHFPNPSKYYWVHIPDSQGLKEKADFIKEKNKWEQLLEQYLITKNKYLNSDDHTHPSFVCYTEAVNHVYHAIEQDSEEKSTVEIM